MPSQERSLAHVRKPSDEPSGSIRRWSNGKRLANLAARREASFVDAEEIVAPRARGAGPVHASTSEHARRGTTERTASFAVQDLGARLSP